MPSPTRGEGDAIGIALSFVMPGLVPGIHDLLAGWEKDVDGRAEASGSDAVLWTAVPGHDGCGK
jgi:hypothetical protein